MNDAYASHALRSQLLGAIVALSTACVCFRATDTHAAWGSFRFGEAPKVQAFLSLGIGLGAGYATSSRRISFHGEAWSGFAMYWKPESDWLPPVGLEARGVFSWSPGLEPGSPTSLFEPRLALKVYESFLPFIDRLVPDLQVKAPRVLNYRGCRPLMQPCHWPPGGSSVVRGRF